MSVLFRITFSLVLGSVLYPSHSRSQSAETVQDVIRQRFETPVAIQWIYTFSGWWQNLHPLEIVLGFDGKEYQGRMHLKTGDIWFDLYGYPQDGRAMIQEIDETGRTSGYLIADIAEGRMTGHWWSVDFSRSAALSLRSEEVVELRRFEPSLMTISGTLDEGHINLIIQREESDLLSGFCSFSNDETLYRISGQCEDATCDRMRLELRSPDGTFRYLQCIVQRTSSIRLYLTDDPGDTLEGTAALTNKYPMQRLHHAEYVGNADCLFPVLAEPAFDTWLQELTTHWYTDMQKHLDSLQNMYGIPGPAERWSLQASAWIDFTLVSPDKISGVVTMFHPEQSLYQRYPFIFDVRSGKLLSIRDVGRKPHFENSLRADAGELKVYTGNDPEYLSWLESAQFKHITLSPDGFVLFTDFDAGYGEQWIKLPYENYLDALKRNAFVFDLIPK